MTFVRESIFLSGMRTLCKALGAVLGCGLAIVLLSIGVASLSNNQIVPTPSEMIIAPTPSGDRSLLPSSSPVILTLRIEGVIGLEQLQSQDIQNLLYDSQEGALQNHRVKGIFLYINSPGGTATDSADIYEALLRYKKQYEIPIYAFVDGLCASGGMYIASVADKIYATSSSIIGSVGVRQGPLFNFSDFLSKVGVQSLTLTEGKDKDALNPFRPWKEGEDISYVEIGKGFYEQFLQVVTTGRPKLDKTKLIHEYGAHIFLAAKAQELGFIDVAGSCYAEALDELAKTCNIADAPYQVVVLSPPKDILSQLVHNKWGFLSGKIEHTFSFGPYVQPELSGKFLYLYQP